MNKQKKGRPRKEPTTIISFMVKKSQSKELAELIYALIDSFNLNETK